MNNSGGSSQVRLVGVCGGRMIFARNVWARHGMSSVVFFSFITFDDLNPYPDNCRYSPKKLNY
jgi:hypothetical protein